MDIFQKTEGFGRARELQALGMYPYFIPLHGSEGTEVEIAGKPANDPAWKKLHPVHTAYANLPWMTRRVILARDWITNAREQLDWQTGKDDGGVRFVNEFFEDRFKRKTDFTAKQIANVEHFYVSAMYSDLTGPALVGVPVALTAIWEFGIGPLRIHYQESQREKEGKPYRSSVVIELITLATRPKASAAAQNAAISRSAASAYGRTRCTGSVADSSRL